MKIMNTIFNFISRLCLAVKLHFKVSIPFVNVNEQYKLARPYSFIFFLTREISE